MAVSVNAEELEERIIERIADPAFPCVGAKSALARGSLKVLACHSLTSNWDDVRIHAMLLRWSHEYKKGPRRPAEPCSRVRRAA